MITEQTVFILGAGASAPYEYPTGAGLKRLICYETSKLLNGLIPEFERFLRHDDEMRKKLIEGHAVEFVKKFKEAPTDFIDRFLETNSKVPNFPETGKILITLSILKAEKDSKFLGEIKNSDFDWYQKLFNLMDKGSKGSKGYLDFKKNKVDFITFNYDRSLDFFLYNSLKQTYGSIDSREHRPLDLVPFKFIHVYGKIDDFPWEDPPGLEYRAVYSFEDILKASNNIKLIHERDDEFLNEIKKVIAKAKNIFFLGFGFDEENMKALGWPKNFNESTKIFATARNASEERIERIRNIIRKGFKKPSVASRNPYVEKLDSAALFEKYSIFLST